jgi:hypothetical protein
VTAEAQSKVAQLTQRKQIVMTVRVMYVDGVIGYYRVTGTANPEHATNEARIQAEMDRLGVDIAMTATTDVTEEDE